MVSATLRTKSVHNGRYPPKGATSRLPIVQRREVSIAPKERSRIADLAASIKREDRHISSTIHFGDRVRAGLGSGPAVLIGDKSEIRLLAPAGQDSLEYRIAMLQQQDDLLVLASERNIAFEKYMTDLLGISRVNILEIPHSPNRLPSANAVRCVEDTELFKGLVRHVIEHSGTSLIPYISTGTIWTLAKRLSETTKLPINVAAAPPNLAQKVNDKLWFADVVRSLFGEKSTPPTYAAYSAAALTGYVQRLAKKWDKLVVKVPDSAGSAGNFPIQSNAVRGLHATELKDHITALISPMVTERDYPLMVEVWDCNVTASPSVQFWIPLSGDELPVIEGVFEQVLLGDQGAFVGAAPSELNEKQDELLCREAMQLALLFQELGYFGRCSFDAVIARDENGNDKLHWIECNGRWGGVSLPMTFMNRMFEIDEMPSYVIVQLNGLEFTGMPFSDALIKAGNDLYDPANSNEGIIFTTPGGIEQGSAIHMISIGKTMDRAKNLAQQVQQKFINPA